MSKHLITHLSHEQEVLLPKYREKWKAIDTLTRPIDQDKVAASVNAAYLESNYPEPTLLFYRHPFAAIQAILAKESFRTDLGRSIRNNFHKRIMGHLIHLMERQLDQPLFYQVRSQLNYPDYPDHLDQNSNPTSFHFPMGIDTCIKAQIIQDFESADIDDAEDNYSHVSKLLETLDRPPSWSIWGCMLDFCISVLDIQHDPKKWKVARELMECCSFIFPFEQVCIVCDRPNILLFDPAHLLHADEGPALQFADGYHVYAAHGGAPLEGRRCQNNEYIEPGTKVKLPSTGEYGIVVYCWYSQEILDFDCYIAFFGTSFPSKNTDCRPYIFRYAAVSLEILE